MALTQSNPLFQRDLKHLVDPKYSMAPKQGRRRLLTALIGVGALAMVAWIAALQFGPSHPTAPDESRRTSKPPETVPEKMQIPPQIAKVEKASVETAPKGRAGTSDVAMHTEPSPKPAASAARADPGSAEPVKWEDYEIARGDSLALIFKHHGLKISDAIRIAAHPDAKEIATLIPGRKMRFGYDRDDQLCALSFELRSNKRLVVRLGPDGSLHFDEVKLQYEKRERIVSATIESSLFKAGAKAGLDDRMILKLVAIFGWDIDFALDLRKGDRFTVVYEELHDGATTRGVGNLLAAEFINQDRILQAFRYVDDEGRTEYYDADGRNLRGTFLRTPVKISRITSRFSKSRLHPVLGKWRAHKGVDYAAPRGTPVLATADGRVSFLGRKKGYGKTIVLRHGGKYSTLYAHLASYKSKIRPGSSVKQGQVIGFVGATGLATGPHLHYEFRVHGEHRDPLAYRLPKAAPVPDDERNRFMDETRQWLEAMAEHHGVQVAQNDAHN